MSLFFINLEKATEERYALSKFLSFTDNYDPLTSTFLLKLSDLKVNSAVLVQGQDKRPDNLSYSIFQDTQYWWVLLYYNDKLSFEDITTGEIIKVPNLDELEELYFSLKSLETLSKHNI